MVRYTLSCGKRRYGSLYAANAALDSIWKLALRGGAGNRSTTLPCRSYACSACRGFHHTSKPTDYWRKVIDERAKSK